MSQRSSGFLPQGCNIEILLEFPGCWRALKIENPGQQHLDFQPASSPIDFRFISLHNLWANYICICVCIYTHREAERDTDRQRLSPTGSVSLKNSDSHTLQDHLWPPLFHPYCTLLYFHTNNPLELHIEHPKHFYDSTSILRSLQTLHILLLCPFHPWFTNLRPIIHLSF